jgi:hypothetical protein
MPLLKEWESFYVIAGSAAAALVGLQFVVMALLADMSIPRSTGGVDAFGTPTVVHFGAALLISGIMTAPWRSWGGPVLLLAVLGSIGVAYAIVVARRTRRQGDYAPVFEDWAFHVLLPGGAYAAITAAALLMRIHAHVSLFAVATGAFLLLFTGIHNAWDTVTYFILTQRSREDESPK